MKRLLQTVVAENTKLISQIRNVHREYSCAMIKVNMQIDHKAILWVIVIRAEILKTQQVAITIKDSMD